MRGHLFWLIVAIVIAAIALLHLREGTTRAQQAPARAGWRQTAPGIEVRKLGDERNPTIAVRVDPARCRIRVVDAHQRKAQQGSTAQKVCPPNGAAINASFFADDLTPIGLVIADGKKTRPLRNDAGWGIFLLRQGRPEIISAKNARVLNVTQAAQSKPRLVIAGNIPSFKSQPPAYRSAVGVDKQSRLLLAASNGLYSLEGWAHLCRDDLGCVNALNLDGGPSAQLAVRGKYPQNVEGGWDVPVLITVEPK
ncbi:MAG: phosphodiester glycosidase family protein [Armatimonadota bacterium]